MFESFLCIDHEVLGFEIPAQHNLPVCRPLVFPSVDLW